MLSINASNNNNSTSGGGGGGGAVSGVSVSSFDNYILLCEIDVHNLQEKDLRDITDEIRKLKAIIVKHENRIRALEAALKSQDDDETDTTLNKKSQVSDVTKASTTAASEPTTDAVGEEHHNNVKADEV